MPTSLFFELDPLKQRRIIDTGILEFAKYGYYNASTNRIVKDSAISKGSLFKYFSSKEDLYFYILDTITAELSTSLEKASGAFPTELFSLVVLCSEAEFAWYISHPEKYTLILNAFTKSDTEIFHKTAARYNSIEQDIFYKLLENVDTSRLKWDKKKTADIIKWFLKGFNEDFRNTVCASSSAGLERIEKEYVNSLTGYMELLKTGLTK